MKNSKIDKIILLMIILFLILNNQIINLRNNITIKFRMNYYILIFFLLFKNEQ
jgi:hypothetical protein